MTSRKRISIRIAITTLFVTISLVTGSTVLIADHLHSKKLARKAAEQEFLSAAERSSSRATTLFRRGTTYAAASAVEPLLGQSLSSSDGRLLAYWSSLMRDGDSVYSMYAGYADGSYIELSNLNAAPGLRPAWGAAADHHWVLIRIRETGNGRVETRQYLDHDLSVMQQVETASSYDPRSRPWFQDAQAGAIVQSAPYLLTLTRSAAVSFSAMPAKEAVSGVIMLLSSISSELATRRFPQSARGLLFTADGFVVADSEKGDKQRRPVQVPVLQELASDPHRHGQLLDHEHSGRHFFVMAKPLESDVDSGQSLYTAFVVERAEVMAPYAEQIIQSILTGVLLILASVPLVFYAARMLVSPMQRLAIENRKVAERRFAQVTQVDSRIREVHELSASLVSMAEAIQAYQRAQQELMDSFIRLIAQAIDDKSPYTGGHCERVPQLAMMLAKKAAGVADGTLGSFRLQDEDAEREFEIAAYLHDCGKITTPEHIADKGSKLEANYNRIHEIRTRFEVLLRDAEIRYWQARCEPGADDATLRQALDREQNAIRSDFEFVAQCNVGGESLDDADIERLNTIGARCWTRVLDDRIGLSPAEEMHLKDQPSQTPARETVLADKAEHITLRENPGQRFAGMGFTMQPPLAKQNLGEIYNLSVRRGTLTDEDRYIIQEHISSTIKMLEMLPFPPRTGAGTRDRRRSPREARRRWIPTRSRCESAVDPGQDHGDRGHLRGIDRE